LALARSSSGWLPTIKTDSVEDVRMLNQNTVFSITVVKNIENTEGNRAL